MTKQDLILELTVFSEYTPPITLYKEVLSYFVNTYNLTVSEARNIIGTKTCKQILKLIYDQNTISTN